MLLDPPTRLRLERAVDEGVASGAVLAVVDERGASEVFAAGLRRRGGAPVTADTRYDVASLTKVVATLPSVLRLVARGDVHLDDPVGRFFSSAGWLHVPSLADVTVRALLGHTSGLPAWRPLFAESGSRRTALAAILQTQVTPPGEVVYSDLGFMLLGSLVERVAHERLDAFARREVFEPLGMDATGFGPVVDAPVAATEDCGWRDRLLEGEVHDENAVVWDGVAGHAGLFTHAADLVRYARAWWARDPLLGPSDLLEACVAEHASSADGARRGLGWALPSPAGFAGRAADGFGHTGFTGTSLWIDPRACRAVVLLTNRIHPRRGPPGPIHRLRVDLHEAIRSAARTSAA